MCTDAMTPMRASAAAGAARVLAPLRARRTRAGPTQAVHAPSAQMTFAAGGESSQDPTDDTTVAVIRASPAAAILLIRSSVGRRASHCHGTMSRPGREICQAVPGLGPPRPASRARVMAAERSDTWSLVMMFDT